MKKNNLIYCLATILFLNYTAIISTQEIGSYCSNSTSNIRSVAYSPKGNLILCGSSSGDVELWDISKNSLIKSYTNPQHGDWVNSVAFSPDGNYILSGSSDGFIFLREINSGKITKAFIGNSSPISSVAFSPDGKFILSGHWETMRSLNSPGKKGAAPNSEVFKDSKVIKLWDVSSGKLVRTFSGHTGWISSVAYSSDGKYILSGSFDKTMKLWAVSGGKNIKTFTGHTGYISSVAFSPNGKFLLSGSWDSTIKLWDISTGKEIRTFIGITDQMISSAVFSPDGKYILSGITGNPASNSNDYSLRLWDFSSGKLTKNFNGHSGSVLSLAFSSDGKYAVSGSWDGTMKLWLIQTK